MSERTEGPWVCGPYGMVWAAADVEIRDGVWREKAKHPRIVASPTNIADGPMLAAAPDLAEALEEMLAAHSMENIGVDASMRRTNAKKAARTALRRAKGEA